jgi:hypothetical protein
MTSRIFGCPGGYENGRKSHGWGQLDPDLVTISRHLHR